MCVYGNDIDCTDEVNEELYKDPNTCNIFIILLLLLLLLLLYIYISSSCATVSHGQVTVDQFYRGS